jgi:hypothetical protein
MQELGEILFDSLFADDLRTYFLELYEKVSNEGALLRIELTIDEERIPHIAALPWEFLRPSPNRITGQPWLATDANVVLTRLRRRWKAARPIQLEIGEKLRIAVVVSAPTDENLGEVDYQKLFHELEQLTAELGDLVELDLVDPREHRATRETLVEVLKKRPHIFHFIGHGTFEDMEGKDVGKIAVMWESGKAHWVNAGQFSQLFTTHRPSIIMLQACEGGRESSCEAFAGVASQIVQQGMPVVVAFQHEISNAKARVFAREFYGRLMKQKPDAVDQAVQEGRNAMANVDWHESRDFATPMLYMRVRDGRLFTRELIVPKTVRLERMRNALATLNYQPQRKALNNLFFWGTLQMGTLIISGSEESGPYWMLKTTIEEEQRLTFTEDSLIIDLGDRRYRNNMRRFWILLAEWLELPAGSPPPGMEEISAKLLQKWHHQSTLIFLDNITTYGSALVSRIIAEFWRPFVEQIKVLEAAQRPSMDKWMLMFLVDNAGKLDEAMVAEMGAVESLGGGWQPAAPVCTEKLVERFPAEDLTEWLGDDKTQLILREATPPQPLPPLPQILNTLLTNSDNGVPIYLIEEMCRLCGYNWIEVEKKWKNYLNL